MRKYIKIYHSPLEVDGDQTLYLLVITEVCLLTNRVVGTYTARLPEWVAQDDNPDYQYYQPIFN